MQWLGNDGRGEACYNLATRNGLTEEHPHALQGFAEDAR